MAFRLFSTSHTRCPLPFLWRPTSPSCEKLLSPASFSLSVCLEDTGSEWNHHVDFLLHPETWDLSEDWKDDASWCARSSSFPLLLHKGKPQKKCGMTLLDVPAVRDVFIFPSDKKFFRIRSARCEGEKRIHLPSALSGFADWRWIKFYRLYSSNIAPQAAASFIHIGLWSKVSHAALSSPK